jgi:hypothetical protein
MATITVNPDQSLTLALTTDERVTYDGLPDGQLANYIEIWLRERFNSVWGSRLAGMTIPQKRALIDLIRGTLPPAE